MSTEEGLGRKAKKAQRDAERKKAGRKRKREEAGERDGQDELKDDFIPLAGGDDTKIAKDGAPSLKKRKANTSSAITADSNAPTRPAKLAKKRKLSELSTTAATPLDRTPSDGTAVAELSKKSRFILFIGNLPYDATDNSITAHFKSIQPFTLRHRVDPKTKKSKGFAFLEFENYDRMKTCLKLYHHSLFDAAAQGAEGKEGEGNEGEVRKKKSKTKSARRINVELTAGGGGKSEERKEKIKVKNAKLEEERKRRREAEEKEAARREKKEERRKTKKKRETGANAEDLGKGGEVGEGEGMMGMNPARLARMKT